MTRTHSRTRSHRGPTLQAPHAPLSDGAHALLEASARVAVALPELAARLDASPATLAAHLEGDERFVLIPPSTFPDLSLLPEADRAAYGAALRAAGIHAEASVALRAPGDRAGPVPIDLLLRNSVARLLAVAPAEELVAMAERMRMAIGVAIATTDDPAGTAPSTTPPPDPLARA